MPPVNFTSLPKRRLAERIRTAEWVLMLLTLLVLLLAHGIARFEQAITWEVPFFVTCSLALLVTGYAVRFWLDAERVTFLKERWLQIAAQLAWLVGLPFCLAADQPFQAVMFWSEWMFILRFGVSLLWIVRRITREHNNPAFVFVVSFLLLITFGTIGLMLPICRNQSPDGVEKSGAPLLTALFTATSAACVTGLIVEDTGSYWSPIGQAIILLLIQLGGLGVMTFAAFFALGQRRGFLLRESAFMGKLLEADDVQAVRHLIRSILIFTLISELLGAIVLTTLAPPGTLPDRLWYGTFHSVSAFCNAGFSLEKLGLDGRGTAWQVWGMVIPLIIVGGLGFEVLRNTADVVRGRWLTKLPFVNAHGQIPHLALTSRLALVTTGTLLAVGAVGFFALEIGSGLLGGAPLERFANAWFQSVTCRTAGFNTVDFGAMRPATKLLAIALMFIGASPGSTGGGIKTTVFAIVVLATASLVRGRHRLEVAARTIVEGYVQRAAAVLMLALGVVLMSTMLLVLFENRPALFIDHLFEVTSAFGTVGLSTGITASLRTDSKLVLIATMFAGRVGPLTVLLALTRTFHQPKYEFPAERVMLG